jgi:hypothetical protein
MPKRIEEKTDFVHIRMELDLLAKLDDFRYRNRFPTRTQAIKWLLREAFRKRLKPEKP